MNIQKLIHFPKLTRILSGLWKDNNFQIKNKILSISIAACFLTQFAFAKEATVDTAGAPKLRKFYLGTGLDAGIFSTAFIKHTTIPFGSTAPSTESSLGTLRFSYVINFGVTFNYNVNSKFGLFTGVDIKNIGYIEKFEAGSGTFTQKHRTYNLGVPLGIKIGNMNPKKMYAFVGGGVDLVLNYREKSFTKRSSKTKMNEWFSQRTPPIMPYVFAGLALNRGITFKAQYYPGNFINPDFVTGTTQPYKGTEVHLLLISVGFSVAYSDRKDIMKKRVEAMQNNNKK